MDAIYLAVGKVVVFAAGIAALYALLGFIGITWYYFSVDRDIRRIREKEDAQKAKATQNGTALSSQ